MQLLFLEVVTARDKGGTTMEEYAENQKKILDIKVNILKMAEKAMETAVKEKDSAMISAIAEIVKAINQRFLLEICKLFGTHL